MAEFDPQLITEYCRRLVNRSDLVFEQQPDGRYLRDKSAVLTTDVILKHLQHKLTLSLPAISLPNLQDQVMCKWCVWDNDSDTDYLAQIKALIEPEGLLPLSESRRTGREGHLWLFFAKPISATHLLRLDDFVRQELNISEKDVEFFPKGNMPNSAPGLRAPLGLNRKPEAKGAIGWFGDCLERSVASQLKWFCNTPLNDTEPLEQFIERLWEIDEQRFTLVKRRNRSATAPETAFAKLNPVKRGNYFECLCPGCGQRRAFFYGSGYELKCNRVYSCDFSITVEEWLKRSEEFTI